MFPFLPLLPSNLFSLLIALMLGAYIIIGTFSSWIGLLTLCDDLFVSCYSFFGLKVYFVQYKYRHSCSFVVTCISFSSLHFQPMYAHKSEMSLLYTAYGWALLFYPFTHSMSLNHEFDSFTESNHWQVKTYYSHFVNCFLPDLQFSCPPVLLSS